MCKRLFDILTDTLKAKLSPVINEFFTLYPSDRLRAIDLKLLANNIFPNDGNTTTDFVFEHEKDFVKKVTQNSKKASALRNDVQGLTNKMNVTRRKLSKERENLSLLSTKLTTFEVDSELKMKQLREKLTALEADNKLKIKELEEKLSNLPVALTPSSNTKHVATYPSHVIASLKRDLKALSTRVDRSCKACLQRHDNQQQYTRRNILELHGVPMTWGENTNDIAIDIIRSMGIPISPYDIDRTHRNPSRHRGRRHHLPPVILVKLICHDKKQQIYDNREVLRFLPGFDKIFINENLTAARRILFRRVRNAFPRYESWSNDGKIYVKLSEKDIRPITCEGDYYDLLNSNAY